MQCMDCDGTGEVEVGKKPGCQCRMHIYSSAECTCWCSHSSEECPFCEGTGQIAEEPDYEEGRPMGHGFSIDEENVFEVSYIETATWSSTGEDGEPLDSDPRVSEAYSQRDVLAPETRKQISEDCKAFLESNEGLLRDAILTGYDLGQAGHDFWLSRNRHGAGFWDRGLGDIGTGLHAMAIPFGETNLYFGDDDLLYLA